MKKVILISLGAIATIGLGYFAYRKIADRNKEIIKDGDTVIIVDKTPDTTTEDDGVVFPDETDD
jgi:hypothetical protein